jgi:predicted DNA-binding protein YlxM (UPF0122 family)
MENKTAEKKVGRIYVSKNVHPNTDGSPWGWIVLDESRRVRIATWSGYDELRMCEQIAEGHNASLHLAEKQKAYDTLREEMESWKKENFENVEEANKTITEQAQEIDRLKALVNEKTIEVMYAESWYELAGISYEFGVTWMHIYDEPPGRHIDRVKWASITNIRTKALNPSQE